MTEPVIVTGIQTGYKPGDPEYTLPVRLEWTDFEQDIDLVTIYVKALVAFQALPQDANHPTSYFQVAGIHGLPYTMWDKVAGIPNNPAWKGYCNHGMDTFPTWHRPYVALYEQCLASQFPSILKPYEATPAVYARLLQKAQKWRLPYFDWALFPQIPDKFASQTIEVLATDGSVTSQNNPLYAYTFHPIDPSFKGTAYANWPTTYRSPRLQPGRNPVSQNDVASANLASDQSFFKQSIIDLFPTTLFEPDPWSEFASHTWVTWINPSGTLTSLESIHDAVHGDIAGDMGDPRVAAFDPIFWLHHCNVDRLLRLWEAAFPDTYVSTGPDHDGNYCHYPDSLPTASDINVDFPLKPFRTSSNEFATSAFCQGTSIYGYTYPEIAQAGNVTPSDLSTTIWNAVHSLYGTGSFVSVFTQPTDDAAAAKAVRALKSTADPAPTGEPLAITVQQGQVRIPTQMRLALPAESRPLPQSHGPAVHGQDYVLTPETYREWIANVTLEKYALNGTGRVSFFLCPENLVPTSFHHYNTSPYYVGSYTIFAAPSTSGCSNCETQRASHLPVGGTVHLTNHLIKRQIGLQEDAAVPYLKANLQWRCANLFDAVPRERVSGLKVLVRSAGYVLPIPVGEVPTRGQWGNYPECTAGKVGGVSEGQY